MSGYFYNQCPEVWKSIWSIALIERSIEFIIKLEYFRKFRNQSSEVQSDVGSDQRSGRQ